MRRTAVLLAAVAASLTFLASGAVLAQGRPSGGGGPERYIVVLKDGEVGDPGDGARELARRHDLQVGFVYRHALKGFSAVIPNDRVAEVRSDGRIDYLERDGVATIAAQTLPWGVDRVQADVSSTKAGNGSGVVSNVNAYIVDSGIDRNHADLNVVNHVNFRGDGKNTDCNGHGTHVAGTVAARDNARDVVGVAPGAPLTGVKVLGCDGSGVRSGIIKGIDWVTANARKPAVANMSLSGPRSQALDDAVRRSAAGGVFYSIAAGNYGANACNYSPARAGAGTGGRGIATTAETNKLNKESSSSNYGSCVDIWAPGTSILSTRRGGGTITESGTSMAAAHVGGGGALYLSSHAGAGAAAVEGALKSNATSTANKSKDGRTIRLENVRSF